MTNKTNSTLYVGMTNNLILRVHQHRTKINKKSFTARYNIIKLVYFEKYQTAYDAIFREKQIKAGSRLKKINLIKSINPFWDDLASKL